MRSGILIVLAFTVAGATGCGKVLQTQYEYEEELYLALDGSATVHVNASVPALVALRGLDLNVNPRSPFERDRIRRFFEGPGASVTAVNSSRRYGRRFVYVSLQVSDVRSLRRLAPFAWSSYRFEREGELFDFSQTVGASAGRAVSDVGWNGTELVAFRLHLPSKIPFHNAPSHTIERGNILVWEQPLADRLRGRPVEIKVQLETESILAQTLLLFGLTALAALATLAALVWWVSRRGATNLPQTTPSHPEPNGRRA